MQQASPLPNFSKLDLTTIESELDQLLTKNRSLVSVLGQTATRDWEAVMLPLIAANDKLDRFWSSVSHLNSVCDSPTLRNVYQTGLKKLVNYATEVAQNEGLFTAFEEVSKTKNFSQLTASQQISLQHAVRDFRLAGVALPENKKRAFKALQEELAGLQTQFEQNVLDATAAWSLHIIASSDLTGLPDQVIGQARNQAHEKGLDGWLFTLQSPSYLPFMQHAENRELRQRMYTAYITRASHQGPNSGQHDNTEIMEQIVCCRQQIADLLGYACYTDLALQTRMANSSEEVVNFLQKLLQHSRAAAEKEWQQLQEFAISNKQPMPIKPWDIAFLSEQLKQQRFNFSDEDVRPYFPLPQVFSGLFALVEQLYGICITSIDAGKYWHEDVRCFQISKPQGQAVGYFYTDLYAREHKRSGAWMAECINRFVYPPHCQLPVAFLSCNFRPPGKPQPALLTHDEVVTLFHEFGHTLHHLLTAIDLPPVAGINGVPWDAVELPSQFMENFCWQEQIMRKISRHIHSNEPLPAAMLNKLLLARNFQSGIQMLRQLELALFDIKLHGHDKQNPTIQAVLDEVRKQTSLIEVVPWNCFQHSFSHIFAGGYAAGYYSYKWAEVLAADAFSRFEEEGLMSQKIGADFLEQILSRGGTGDPSIFFVNFRGRKPTLDALLRYSGLLTSKPKRHE